MMRCEPVLVKDNGTSKEWRCSLCGFTDTDKHGHFPHKIVRECSAPRDRTLTPAGRIAIRLRPGDRIAWIAGATGTAAAWKAWIGSICTGCGNRQRRINDAWLSFVWKYLSHKNCP